MSVKLEKKQYGVYGECVTLSNEIVDLVVTVQKGPRVIRFGFLEKENLFCEAPDAVMSHELGDWRIMGGHRLWHAPEVTPRSYIPDNDPVNWIQIPGGVKVTQPTEQWTGVQKEMEITLSDDQARVKVLHRLTNRGAWEIELAPWALSVMAPGGTGIIPIPQADFQLLPHAVAALWPYAKMNDARVTFGERFLLLKQDVNCTGPWKIGMSITDGWAAYANFGQLFVKHFPFMAGKAYPDYGCNFETYTCNFMHEVESVGPLTRLQPGASVEHVEDWSLYDGVTAPENDADVVSRVLTRVR